MTRQLEDPFHFDNSKTISVENLYPGDQVQWKVIRHEHPSGDDGTVSLKTTSYTTQTITLNSFVSELLEIEAIVTSNNGSSYKLTTKATTNAPSPYTGTLAWDTNNGQFGATTNQNWGMSLSVSNDFILNLEYLDCIFNVLKNLNYTCVTATRRALRGSSMSLTKSDCADGYLKFKVSADCGTATNYFTIPVVLTGSYYSLDFQENGDLKVLYKESSRNAEKITAFNKKIIECSLFTMNNKLRIKETNKTSDNLILQTSRLPKGEYLIVIKDEEGEHKIPFCL